MTIEIEGENLTSELTPGELMYLKAIYTDNSRFKSKFEKVYPDYIDGLKVSLENKMFIKIADDNIMLREKALQLFEQNKENFDYFWKKYHEITKLPKTDSKSAFTKWKGLSSKDKSTAIDNIEKYYNSLNNKMYCKKARTYLADRNFEDEFVVNNSDDNRMSLTTML